MEPVTLHTERLELSTPLAADVDAVLAACQDPAIARYTTVPSPYERRHAEEFIDRVARNWADDVEQTWAIRDGDVLAGMIGLYRQGAGAAELGYWIGPASRQRGFGTEASRAVVDWAFSREGLGLQRIEWRAVVGNIGSARIARALGFHYEGTLRQALRNGSGHRDDGWIAGLLATDDRLPQEWPVLG
ncbi:GNAT family N-acetyltransferase [Microbacterium sp. BK668]|uniref:GNAT family N-acetyltransferase n=1 Tax=Microbacterium sp. BK668 TaxID=2512118 RepID=UPI001060DD74|nr:GNAT family N-acetyltransferase [Microbacterium sp. BK668]TDN87824.1 RimJ/RimL family protein N-acetyltransferase [Microbacterium sp. BK668]